MDIDWEFPACSQFDNWDNFGSLLRELRSVFLKTLSVAVSASETIISVSYNASVLKETVDFVNLMSYDFHDCSPFFHSSNLMPLFLGDQKKMGFFRLWTSIGLLLTRIVVGIPSYSHNRSVRQRSSELIVYVLSRSCTSWVKFRLFWDSLRQTISLPIKEVSSVLTFCCRRIGFQTEFLFTSSSKRMYEKMGLLSILSQKWHPK